MLGDGHKDAQAAQRQPAQWFDGQPARIKGGAAALDAST